jgi:hypothetical protein
MIRIWDRKDGGEKGMNRTIKSVMLTVLIAITLGMTSLPTVLSPKVKGITVTVMITCYSATANAGLTFEKPLGTDWETFDAITATCGTQSQTITPPRVYRWLWYLNIEDPAPGNPALCSIRAPVTTLPLTTLTTYPLSLLLLCNSGTIGAYIEISAS